MCSSSRTIVECSSSKVWSYRCSTTSIKSSKRADAQVQIESAAKEYETEMVRMQTELQTKYGEYQEKAATVRCYPSTKRRAKH